MWEKELKKAAEIIARNQTFLIACHVRPDGDTLGSSLALAIALRRLGKKVTVLSVDGVPDTYSFLPGTADVLTDTPERGFDVAILPDSDGPERVGDALEIVKTAKLLLSIDHHGSHPPFGDAQLCDPSYASTGEIVLELFDQLGVALDKDIADCLMTAMVSDTGAFRFPNVTAKTFQNAARFTAVGASASQVAQLVYESKSFESTGLLGVVLASLEKDETGEVVWGRVTLEDFRRTGASDSDTEGIINHIRAIKGAKVALLFKETADNAVVISLRSKDSIDVSKVAQVFGGGGHMAASGCTIQATLAESERIVIEEVHKWMAS
ncbi:MAG: bifunctional oligoribonuclease/PAP phosphatase NrnA [Armatimonadota bacterium]|nr:bifunctional oligoribonuclease/PAP phosphatase NrnA [Armatimonadota bacterium]